MTTFLADLRFAFRVLSRDRIFAVAAVSILAIGIGAAVSVFSVFEAAVLSPLPFPAADRLVSISAVHRDGSTGAGFLDFSDWRRQNTVFDDMAIETGRSVDVTGPGTSGEATAERLAAGLATAGFFELLRVRPAMGRFFEPEEDRPDAPPVVILTHGFWQRRLGASANVIGRTLTLDGRQHTIIGVLPASFHFPGSVTRELWLPLAERNSSRTQHQYDALARLKHGTTIERAQADLATIARRLEAEYPSTNAGWGVVVRPLHDVVVQNARPTLILLLSAIGMVLILACTSIVTLQLARSTARRREMGVRMALGAARWRLVRQLLTEGMVLAGFGTTVGIGMAYLGGRLLAGYIVARMRLNVEPGMDLAALAVAVSVAVLAGLLFAVMPVLHALGSDLMSALRSAGSATSGSQSERRTLSALVVGEIALGLVLLVGAGLLLVSLRRLSSVDTGIRTANLLTFQLGLPRWKYTDPASRAQLTGALLTRLAALPGVAAVGGTNTLPMSGMYSGGPLEIRGRPVADGARMRAKGSDVTAGYFATLGIPMRGGRAFSASDGRAAPPVAIISETMARHFWPGEDPVGAMIKFNGAWHTVVGVAGDVRHNGPAREPLDEVYLPAAQSGAYTPFVAVRTLGDPRHLLTAVVREVGTLDRDAIVLRARTMDDIVASTIAQPRLTGMLTAVFASLCLLLAVIALYGVTSWTVARRKAEIGVRIALGADRASILRLIIGQGMGMAATGIAIGLLGAFIIAPLLARLLYGVQPRDPIVFALSTAVVVCVAFAANIVPAHRAASLDPSASLRLS